MNNSTHIPIFKKMSKGSSTNHVDWFLGFSDPSPNMDQFTSIMWIIFGHF